MRLRRLMVAILVVAVLSGFMRLMRRRSYFLDLAEAHASRKYDYGKGRGFVCPNDDWYEGDRIKPEWWEFCDKMRDWSGDLEQKYRKAASQPWLSVEPDPPDPAGLRIDRCHPSKIHRRTKNPRDAHSEGGRPCVDLGAGVSHSTDSVKSRVSSLR